MGRYSYSQPSSSSVRLCGDESDGSDGDRGVCSSRQYGIPNLCWCGLPTMMKTMDSTDEFPGRMFFGCKKYKGLGTHLLKWWDEAMMEEFILLQRATDHGEDCLNLIRLGGRIEKEVAELKEMILEQKPKRNVIFLAAVILLVGLIIYLCARMTGF